MEIQPDQPQEESAGAKPGKKKRKHGNAAPAEGDEAGGDDSGQPSGGDAALIDDRRPEEVAGGKGERAKIRMRGFLHVQGNYFPDTNDDTIRENTSVIVRRARVGVRGRIVKGITFEVEADVSENMGIMKDAYVSIDLIPHHKLRLGQNKTPFGYENSVSSTRLFVLYRSEPGGELSRGPDLRDIGAFLGGKWRLPLGLQVEYDFALVNGAGANAIVDNTPRKSFWGRTGVGWRSPMRDYTVDLGVSYGNGDRIQNPLTNPIYFRFTRYGADLTVDTPFSFLAVEYQRGTDRRAVLDINHSGYYALLALKSPWNAGPIARYQVYDPDSDRPGPIIRRWTLGAYYDYRPIRARFLINYEMDRSTPRVDDAVHAWTQILF